LEFDSQLEHTGTTCTDNNVRAVINLNYFKWVKNLNLSIHLGIFI
jgi:hypothetical protein